MTRVPLTVLAAAAAAAPSRHHALVPPSSGEAAPSYPAIALADPAAPKVLHPGKSDEPEPRPEGTAGRLPRGEDPEVFILHVIAQDPAGFRGDDILQILLACDLRFGDMDFFHRHEQAAGRGAIQFSVANMMQPGVFDIDRMSELTTPGLLFFVTLPGPEDMMKAFDYMLETAQAVARNLGGDVLDEARSALTRQSLEHSR